MEPNSKFIDNKYQKWYFRLINKALFEDRKKSSKTYYELHHIIPRALGGSNSKRNLVLLTAKEHFLAHAMLCKFTENEAKMKMFFALRAFKSTSKIHQRAVSSKMYDILRRETSSNRSKVFAGQNNPMFGVVGPNSPTFGHKWYNDGIREYKVHPDKAKAIWIRGRLHPTTQNVINRNPDMKAKKNG